MLLFRFGRWLQLGIGNNTVFCLIDPDKVENEGVDEA